MKIIFFSRLTEIIVKVVESAAEGDNELQVARLDGSLLEEVGELLDQRVAGLVRQRCLTFVLQILRLHRQRVNRRDAVHLVVVPVEEGRLGRATQADHLLQIAPGVVLVDV